MNYSHILLFPLRLIEWISLTVINALNSAVSDSKSILLSELTQAGLLMKGSIELLKSAVDSPDVNANLVLTEKLETLKGHGEELSLQLLKIHEKLVANGLSPSDYESAHKIIDDAKKWSSLIDTFLLEGNEYEQE